MSNYRDRKFLDLAHYLDECMNCDKWTAGCEPAHENGVAAGKGFGIKSHDLHAALCHECHAWYDQGGNGLDPSGLYEPIKTDKGLMWARAFRKTMLEYLQRGWLKTAR